MKRELAVRFGHHVAGQNEGVCMKEVHEILDALDDIQKWVLNVARLLREIEKGQNIAADYYAKDLADEDGNEIEAVEVQPSQIEDDFKERAR